MSRQMKDSGSAWLRDIPDDWKVIKLKYIFGIIGGNGFPEQMQGKTEGDFPFCKVSDINSNSIFVDSAVNYVSTDEVESNRFNIIPVNSIIMAKIGAALMKNHRKINSIPCCIDNNTQALVPKKECNILYLFYLMKCIDMKWFDNNSTIPSVNNTKLMDFIVPWICAEEQSRIADYLDQQCAHIDAVIEKTKASIEEYKKLKQAVITQAVTKGIRGDRPMKDSGIEWIGEIPADWEVTKLKYICNTQGRIGFKGYTVQDQVDEGEGALSLGATHMVNGKISLNNPVYISWDKYYESPEIMVKKNDLLIVQRGSTIGKVAIVDKDYGEVTINPSLVLINKICINPLYLLYSLSTNYVKTCIEIIGSNTAIPMISQKQINDLVICMPKEKELNEILAYLDEKCVAIDELIEKKEKTVIELENYKKSLIYEYVTGKKEVPQSCQ